MALIKKTGWGCIFFFLSLFISPRYYIIYLMVNSRPLFIFIRNKKPRKMNNNSQTKDALNKI